jgi:hypothetical protein
LVGAAGNAPLRPDRQFCRSQGNFAFAGGDMGREFDPAARDPSSFPAGILILAIRGRGATAGGHSVGPMERSIAGQRGGRHHRDPVLVNPCS